MNDTQMKERIQVLKSEMRSVLDQMQSHPRVDGEYLALVDKYDSLRAERVHLSTTRFKATSRELSTAIGNFKF